GGASAAVEAGSGSVSTMMGAEVDWFSISGAGPWYPVDGRLVTGTRAIDLFRLQAIRSMAASSRSGNARWRIMKGSEPRRLFDCDYEDDDEAGSH
ncbi:MAG: hypothetical protein L0312_08575, partial [Acidobacteria bacterium]|nr:hypothetical protein [Acidobacteriota bacterium]